MLNVKAQATTNMNTEQDLLAAEVRQERHRRELNQRLAQALAGIETPAERLATIEAEVAALLAEKAALHAALNAGDQACDPAACAAVEPEYWATSAAHNDAYFAACELRREVEAAAAPAKAKAKPAPVAVEAALFEAEPPAEQPKRKRGYGIAKA